MLEGLELDRVQSINHQQRVNRAAECSLNRRTVVKALNVDNAAVQLNELIQSGTTSRTRVMMTILHVIKAGAGLSK